MLIFEGFMVIYDSVSDYLNAKMIKFYP
jgi:hypothetical protein